MSDNYEYDEGYYDDEQEQEANGPRALREELKKLKAALAAERKKSEKLQTSVVERSVADVLAGQNFKNPVAVKKAILADGVDATDAEALQSWLTENGDDYAKAASTGGNEEQPAPVDSQVVQNHDKLNVPGTPVDAGDWQDRFTQVQAKITPDMDGEAVARLYREHGI